MSFRLIFLTLLTFTTLTIYGQEINKCDLSFLYGKQIGQLTKNEIKSFLLTFDNTCKNNVEYSEGSNGLLFILLDKQTELTLQTIEEYKKSISLDLILSELTSPINDGFDIRDIIKKVQNVQVGIELKSNVVDNLKVAEGKMN